MSNVSRERNGRRSRDGPLASAARTRKRLVSDLLPGRTTSASTGPGAAGTDQSPSAGAVDVALSDGSGGRVDRTGSGEGIVGLRRGELGLATGGTRRVLGLAAGLLR